MRALAKSTKPPVLVDNEDPWTSDYVAAVASGDARSVERWRHPEIRSALKGETKGKCAYCEAFLADVSYPHVEHLVPKSLRPDLAHRWDNLTSACGPCNVAKGSFYDPVQGLLNPYEDALEKHLEFFGNFVDWTLGSVRGEITLSKLRLNRLELAESRLSRLRAIRNMLERWYEATGIRKEILAEGIRLDLAEGEFTAAVRVFLLSKEFPVEA